VRWRWLLAVALAVAVGLGALITWANLPPPPLPEGVEVSRVVVDKSERRLSLLDGERVVATYPVSLGAAPAGHKLEEGDERTPEGLYTLDWRNERSIAFLSLHVSYPSASDQARARAEGVDPGGDIMIHGIVNGLGAVGRLHRLWDWTDGCIALTNAEMQQVWDAVPNGTPIEIR